MLSSFSWASWPSVCPLWRNVYSGLLHIFFFFKELRVWLFIYFFIYGCAGSSPLCEASLQLWQAGATLHCGARASHHRVFSCCGAQVSDAQAQQLWLTGPVAPRHVGSSQTRARTCVPCSGRQILNHCATREAPAQFLIGLLVFLMLSCMSCLYILEINPLSVDSFANIFSHSEGCLFVLFVVFFAL